MKYGGCNGSFAPQNRTEPKAQRRCVIGSVLIYFNDLDDLDDPDDPDDLDNPDNPDDLDNPDNLDNL